ncbi:DUF4234 domain-containing protein [Candidatus Woesearchaeota archaeon]|nr:DUF4234 domain-containing protein [Candidatus Woesearchaeota archaeon]
MISPQLLQYLETEEAQGYTDDQLRKVLLDNGYPQAEVEEALKESRAAPREPATPTPPSEPQAGQQSQPESQADSAPPESDTAEDDNKQSFTRRGVVGQLLLSLVTFGIYGIVWLGKMSSDLIRAGHDSPNPKKLWWILVPIANIIIYIKFYIKFSGALEEATGFGKTGMIVLLLLLNPVGLIIAQAQLNKQ